MFVRFGVADVRSVPGFVPCGFDCAASTMRPVGHRRSGCAFDAVSLPFALSVSPAVPHGPDLVSCLVWSACPSWLDRLVSRLFRVALVGRRNGRVRVVGSVSLRFSMGVFAMRSGLHPRLRAWLGVWLGG